MDVRHYLEGSVVAYDAERLDQVIADELALLDQEKAKRRGKP